MDLLNALTVQELCYISTSVVRPGQHGVMSKRPNFGISLCRRGRIVYHQNGQAYLSDSNHVIVYPYGGTYVWDCLVPGEFPIINFYGSCALPQTTFLSIPVPDQTAFLAAFTTLEQLFLFEREQSRAAMLSLFYHLLAELSEIGQEHPAPPLLAPALAYLKEHYADPALTNTALADCANISEVYFRRLFRETYGQTPGQYLQQIRLRKAKQLLSESDTPIAAIAAATGYASVYHFSRLFHEKTGATPTEYRQTHRRTVL